MSTSESLSRLPRFARRQSRPDCGRRNLGMVCAVAIGGRWGGHERYTAVRIEKGLT